MLAKTFASFIFFVVVAEATTSQYKWIDEVGSCKLHYLPAAWQEARLRCEHEGSVMASTMKPGLLTPLMKEFGRQQVFLAIHTAMTGEYYSIDGTPLDSISVEWAPNEPDNLDDSESCLALNSNGTVSDVKCSHHLPYICCKDTKKAENHRLFYILDNYISNMKKNSIEEKPQESDNDISNWTSPPSENQKHAMNDNDISNRTSPTSEEQKEMTNDNDISNWRSLTSEEQKEMSNDYYALDVMTSYEQTEVTNDISSTGLPSLALKLSNAYTSTTTPSSEENVLNDEPSDGYDCDKSTGSCYKVHPIESTWAQAYNGCIADSAQLLVVNSQQEAKFLADWAYRTHNLYSFLYYVYFIGYRATGDERTWKTIDGQPLSELEFLAWDYDTADNMTRFGDNGGDCGNIVIHDNSCYFQSQSCENTMFFICEKKMVQELDAPEVEPTKLDDYYIELMSD